MSAFETRFPADVVEQRRQAVAQVLGDRFPVVLFAAGEPIGKPGGLDACYPFIPHPEYYWLTGYRRAGGVLAYAAGEGFRHFTKLPTPRERLFDGGEGIPPGEDVDDLHDWLKSKSPGNVVVLGAGLADFEANPAQVEAARELVNLPRRRKDASEMKLLSEATAATHAGFRRIAELIEPGMTERQLQVELEAEFFRNGADGVGYDTIVATGTRASVLHCMPGSVAVSTDDVVLVDAGAEIEGYTTDVTRTYAATGKFTAQQQAFYDAVSAAIDACLAACRPGVEWHDIHRLAARTMADGLRDMGILKIDAQEALETEAISLFFPHGIGHLVGLGVRDVGGHAPGREPDGECLGVKVRVDLPLEVGHLMTVEPGLYFVAGILDDPENREKFSTAVDWDKLEAWRGVGGVRLEDDVLVTEGEPEVITACIPR